MFRISDAAAAEISKLSNDDKIELAEHIFSQVHEIDPVREKEIMEEVHRRIRKYEAGESKTYTLDEVMAKYR